MFWQNKVCGTAGVGCGKFIANGCSDENNDEGTPSAAAAIACAHIPNDEIGDCCFPDGICGGMN